MEAFGLEVDEKSSAIESGTQTITHPDGYKIPLSYVSGLPYMSMRPPTLDELADDAIPQVFMTSDMSWDPSTYDGDPKQHDIEPSATSVEPRRDLWDRDAHITRCIYEHNTVTIYKPTSILPAVPDYGALRPMLGWVPAARIMDTIPCTTQW